MSSICGFSFGKDLVKLDFPVVESVRSVLPICDRFVFVVGRSDDGTRQRVASIDPKVQIIDSQWPDVKVDGTVLAIEANKALAAATATGCDWGFYIQADEVVHEHDLPIVNASCARWAGEARVKALQFWYHHFVLDYRTVDPWMYHKACRAIRLDGSCEIVGDACGPGLKDYTGPGKPYLDKNHLGEAVQWAGTKSRPARIFHYGWVKTREQFDDKLKMHEDLWFGSLTPEQRKARMQSKFGRFLKRYPMLKNFDGSHPAVMADRIAKHPPYKHRRNRWLNPAFYAEVLRHGFHG